MTVPFSVPFHQIAGDAAAAPVVDLGSAGVGVTGQVLDVLKRHVLGKQVRDHQDPERVGREDLRQPGRLEPALEHQLDGERRHRPIGQRTAAALPGPIQRRGLGRVLKPGPLEVGRDPLVEIVAHRDLPRLPSFFRKLQRPVLAVVAKILHPEPGDGPDPGAGVDERPEDRPVPKPVHVAGFDGGEELPGLVDRHLGRPALPVRVAHPPDRLKGIEDRRVPGHQGIEEVAQSGQGLVLGGGTTGELVQEPAGQPWRDLVQLQPLVLAPSEEPAHLVGVGGSRMGVGDPRGEELVRGEAGARAGPHENGREGPFEVLFGRRIVGSEGEVGVAHISYV